MPENDKLPNGSAPDQQGERAFGLPRVSLRQGFAELLDLGAPVSRPAAPPPGTSTEKGMRRTGNSLRRAIDAFRDRSSG